MTGTSPKFKAIGPQVWTMPLLFLFLRYPTNVYIPSEISTPTKCLPKLSQGQLFSKYFSWAQQTGIPHNTWDPASRGFHLCPVAIPQGGGKVRALSLILAGAALPPDPPQVSHPKEYPPAGPAHPQPSWRSDMGCSNGCLWNKSHPSSPPGAEGPSCLMCL